MKLKDLEKLCELATPGPWCRFPGYTPPAGNKPFRYRVLAADPLHPPRTGNTLEIPEYSHHPEDDCNFIAAMRTAAPLLIAIARAVLRREAYRGPEEHDTHCLDSSSDDCICGADDIKKAFAALFEVADV